MSPIDEHGHEQSHVLQVRRLGFIYAGYRVVLTLILALLFVLTFNNPVVGADNPYLYASTVVAYFIVSIVLYVTQ